MQIIPKIKNKNLYWQDYENIYQISIDDGYYLMQSSNGQADSTSEFMFGVVMGYEIKNGNTEINNQS